jgi:hypothetical protein
MMNGHKLTGGLCLLYATTTATTTAAAKCVCNTWISGINNTNADRLFHVGRIFTWRAAIHVVFNVSRLDTFGDRNASGDGRQCDSAWGRRHDAM